ncbi:MAG: bifunctional (p)ppGpp synthetase/guanosine-3',5'-bis(diphosphate) 3'-pyrophosphohydrolase [bacterium]
MPFSLLKPSLETYFSEKDIEDIHTAFAFAKEAHKGQMRKSGEPYIEHPVAVAKTLAQMHLDKETIIAALLHDVPEDTSYGLDTIEKAFGENVEQLVSGVTKLGKVRLRTPEERQAENIRKMMLAVATDVRVILIKLADRLHNMKTISAVHPKKQQGIALETIEIYAPIAHRLGINQIKWQLEDYSFRVLEPEKYKEIEEAVKEKRQHREEYIHKISEKLHYHLNKEKIEAEISGRPKNLYGIYRNVYIEKKDPTVNDVLDMYGLRVIVDTIPACYRTLGIIHAQWKPLSNRLKDYIAVPKSNGYQSLHTGVVCDGGKIVEVQIRTHDMHYTAEYGLAAHWRYKDQSSQDAQVDERIAWIRQLLDWQKEMQDAEDFVESLKLDLFQDEIFVFTPKGDVKNLPLGSTPVDFAFAVHTDLGNRCIGAKVNNRMVSLDYQLKSGDIIEIMASKAARGPSRSWLEFVKTSSTRNKIRRWFRKDEREENVKTGKEIFEQELRRILGVGISAIPKDKAKELFEKFKANDWEDIFAAIGYGHFTVRQVLDQVIEREADMILNKPSKKKAPKKQIANRAGVRVEGVQNLLIRLAPCCNPEPGQKIAGFITRGKGVTIHQIDCKNLLGLSPEDKDRVVKAYWEEETVTFYPITFEMTVWDRVGLMRDIVTGISDLGINIHHIDYKKMNDSKGVLRLVLEIKDSKVLNDVLRSMERVPDIMKIERV